MENCIESAVVLCDDGRIDVDDLGLATRTAVGASIGDPGLTLAAVERRHIEGVLDACGGNQSDAARKLAIGRNTLARKLQASS